MKGNSKRPATDKSRPNSDMQNKRQIPINKPRLAFHEARRIQTKLSDRFNAHPLFLPRNLRRCIRRGDTKLKEPMQVSKRPNVLYRSVESNVPYRCETEDIQCLWCHKKVYRFRNTYELLQHLKCCHPLFYFSIETGTEYSSSLIVINMRLSRNSGVLTGKEKFVKKKLKKDLMFHHYMFETTLVHKRKFKYLSSAESSNETKENMANSMKTEGQSSSKRPRRACRGNTNTAQMNGVDPTTTPSSSNDGLIQKSNKGRGSTKGGRHRGGGGQFGSSKTLDGENDNESAERKRKITFHSIEEGTRNGRLFHPIEQTRLHLEKFEMVDSDHEDEAEQHWRFQIKHEELVDFTDTIPSEMLFMHLWNQFVGMEYELRSDRCVSKACMAFVKKYHRAMRRLKFEVSFIRFLREMHDAGLIYANDVFDCMMKLRELGSDSSPGDAVENEPPFIYEENLLRTLAKDIRKKKRIEKKRIEEGKNEKNENINNDNQMNSVKEEVQEKKLLSAEKSAITSTEEKIPSS